MSLGLAIALIIFWLCIGECVITFDDGLYNGIVVAIGERVQEDKKLIENIKALFIDGSKLLHNVTEGQVAFKSILIAVPPTWRKKAEYQNFNSDPFSSAHVRVDVENPEYGDRPYTLHAGNCGNPGHYIHFTPNFINGNFHEFKGDRAKFLVREWLRFRYGVLDEYSDPSDTRFPPFYFEGEKMLPTSCLSRVEGWIRDSAANRKCHRKLNVGFSNCAFVPNALQQNFPASMMFGVDILSVDKICNESPPLKHNRRAPTPQNIFCKRQSVWTTIMNHSDFESKGRRKQSPLDPEPNFLLLRRQSEDVKMILILDASEDMEYADRIDWIRQSAIRFVKDDIPDGALLAVSTFDQKDARLQEITNQSRETIIKEILKIKPMGRATFDDGLKTALQILKNSSSDNVQGGIITLVTGTFARLSSTDPGNLSIILPTFVDQRIIVNTVAFGAEADNRLENASKTTGGSYTFVDDLAEDRIPRGLEDAFFLSINSQTDLHSQPVKIVDHIFEAKPACIDSYEFFIDDDLGKKTVIKILSRDIRNVDAIVTDPANKKYNHRALEYNRDEAAANRILFTFSNSTSGLWRVDVINADGKQPHTVSLTVKSWPRYSRKQTVRLRTWLSGLYLQGDDLLFKMFAELKKDYRPVIGATVIAKLELRNKTPTTFVMNDNGRGVDISENDGIYTGYLNTHPYTFLGRYPIVVYMRNEGRAKVRSSSSVRTWSMTPEEAKKLGLGAPKSVFSISDVEVVEKSDTRYDTKQNTEVDYEPLPINITRVSDVMCVPVYDFPEIVKEYLTYDISVIKCVNKSVTLKWKTPEQVVRIELRANTTFPDYGWTFEDDFLIEDEHVTEGNISATPGKWQTLTLRMPEFFFPEGKKYADIHFSIVGFTEYGSQVGSHDVVTANFGLYETDVEAIKISKLRAIQRILFGFGALIGITLLVYVAFLFSRRYYKIPPPVALS